MKKLLRSRLNSQAQRGRLNNRLRKFAFETFEQRILLDGGLANSVVSEVERQEILAGLAQVASWSDSLSSTGRLSQPIALVNQSIGESVGFRTLLETQLIAPVSAATAGGVGTTSDAIVAALKSLTFNSASVRVTVDPLSVTGGRLTDVSGDEFQFSLAFDAVRTISTGLNLGQQVADAGISLDPAARVSLDASLRFIFTFGVNLTPGLPTNQRFFIRPQTISLGEMVHEASFTAPAKVGLLATLLLCGKASQEHPLVDRGIVNRARTRSL